MPHLVFSLVPRLRRLIPAAALLAAGVAEASPASVAVEPSLLATPPRGTVTVVTAGGVKGDVQDALYENVGDSPLFGRLEGTRIDVAFRDPVTLRRLALLRIGWPDWAVPERVALSLDGRPAGEFSLGAPNIAPGKYVSPEPRPVDVIDLGDERRFSKLSVTVLSTSRQRGDNAHGTFRLALPVRPPLAFGLAARGPVPTDSIGVEFEVQSAGPVASPAFAGKASQFRIGRSLSAPLPPFPAGRSTHRVLWSQLGSDFDLPARLSPLNFYELTLADASGKADWSIVSWRFLTDPARAMATAFDARPLRALGPDAEGWRPGIPADGFGRFGWLDTNGLLVGAFSPDSLSNVVAINASGKPLRTATWHIRCGDAGVLQWKRTRARWTLAEHLATYDYSDGIKNELSAKAPDLLKKKRSPQRIIGSILAPGILVDSEDSLLRLTLGSGGKGAATLLYPTANGLEKTDLSTPIDGGVLSEGWLVVTWEAEPASPLLIALKKRPESIAWSADSSRLTLSFPGAFERVGLGFPLGYIDPGRDSGQGVLSRQAVAEKARMLASILRAYPAEVAQRFRPSGDDAVEIEETVSHLSWQDDWHDPVRPVAPVAPLLVFASRLGNYPVTLPPRLAGAAGWETKYGPYCFVDGDTVRYTLPVPPVATRLYPAPAVPDALTARVAARLTGPRDPGSTPLALDSLAGFGQWSAASLALPLMDDAGREAFLGDWRKRLALVLDPHAWYVRREPFSGAAYAVSFGWREQQTDTMADLNSGLGAALYGLCSYARASGDWAFAREHWAAARAAMEYFAVSHDWNNMQTAAREHSGSSAIDMDCVAFQGVAAYAEMARLLGHPDDEAWARFLLSRLSVSLSMRWLGNRWINPRLKPADYDSIGVGLSEQTGFDLLSSSLGADYVNGELALSLSWLGQFPVVYDAQLQGLGRPFFDWLERDFVEKKIPDWRVDHPGNRNNHPANVCAHLYLRGLLGAPLSGLRDELARQSGWGLDPRDIVARENAPLYAMLAGGDFPVSLRSWDKARVERWSYDAQTREATLRARGTGEDVLTFAVASAPASVRVNGEPSGAAPADGALRLPLPGGETTVVLKFSQP